MTLLKEIENEFGSHMGPLLCTNFYVLEAATKYLKEHHGKYKKGYIKKILDQLIDNHVTNQNDINNPSISLTGTVDECFNAWWKGTPEPRDYAEQEEEAILNNGLAEDPIKRVIRIKDETTTNKQQHNTPQDNTTHERSALAEELLKPAEELKDLYQRYFKGVTSGQLNNKLKELGIPDRATRKEIRDYWIHDLFKNISNIEILTDSEIGMTAAGEWITKYSENKFIYVADSKTYYYLNGNKYTETPPATDEEGNPIENPIKAATDEYINYLRNIEHENPLAISAIDREIKRIEQAGEKFEYHIQKAQNHTEAEFNKNVLTEGQFCTPNGLYNYTNKISDSNGLTKVTTNANILNIDGEQAKHTKGFYLFNEFMTSIQPEKELCTFLTYVLVNAITGHRNDEYTYILYGPTGSNGKTIFMNFVQHLLKNYYSDYNTNSLKRNARGETAEQAAKALENRRVVGGREIGEGDSIDSGLFKQYFSNDSYRINEKYKPSYSVMPTHTMFLPVNQIPNLGSESAIYRRLIVIPFTQHFVDNPDPRNPHEHAKDNTILKQLIEHEDEIFTYLVYIAQAMIEENIKLEIPATVKEYTSRMLDKNNVLVDFIYREAVILTEEELNNSDIPTPIMTMVELFERYKESLPRGIYNPYKTLQQFIDALLMKYPQLKRVRAQTTNGKQQRGIAGIWLKRDTTAAIQLDNKRKDADGMINHFNQFKLTYAYEEWRTKNISKDNVKTTTQSEQQE